MEFEFAVCVAFCFNKVEFFTVNLVGYAINPVVSAVYENFHIATLCAVNFRVSLQNFIGKTVNLIPNVIAKSVTHPRFVVVHRIKYEIFVFH